MALKVIGETWECKNQCGNNCCSEIFLPLPPPMRKTFEEQGFWLVDNNYTDFRWLEFHKAIKVEKMGMGSRKLILKSGVPREIKFNPFKGYDEIYVLDKCCMLMDNHKCRIFRARPDICRKAKCIVFDKNPEILWYGENGLLKDVKKWQV